MTDAQRTRILLAVSAAAFLGPFTQTVYAPSLVEIGADLHASTLLVNLTISVYSIVFAVGSFAAFLMRNDAGGVLISKVKDLSW